MITHGSSRRRERGAVAVMVVLVMVVMMMMMMIVRRGRGVVLLQPIRAAVAGHRCPFLRRWRCGSEPVWTVR